MAVTVQVYNHTTRKFGDGSFAAGDTYKLMLCTAATFNGADSTLGAIVKTESSGGGYPAGGFTLANVSVSTVDTDDASFDADDIVHSVVTTSLSASFGILYNNTEANDPPLALIDFDGEKVATDGGTFAITWDAQGIFKITVV